MTRVGNKSAPEECFCQTLSLNLTELLAFGETDVYKYWILLHMVFL